MAGEPVDRATGDIAAFLLPSDRMGGAERITRTLAREAAKSGRFMRVEIFVLCWSRTGTLDALQREHGVRLHYTEAKSERGGVTKLALFLCRRRYALVFSSSTHLNAFCSFLRGIGFLRTQRLVSRESTSVFDRQFSRFGKILRALYMFYGAQDLVVCQSRRMQASLSKATRGRLDPLLRTIPNPVDFDRVKEGLAAEPPYAVSEIPHDRIRIAWCGRLSPVKSPDRAVETLRHLHCAGITNAHLVMIGDGPMRAELIEALEVARLSAFATLVGYCENPISAMRGSAIGLVTSDVEGFPNVILEMLAAGVPEVVSTNCAGGLDEIGGVTVVEGVAPSLLSAAIVDWLSERDKRSQRPPDLRPGQQANVNMMLFGRTHD